MCKFWILFIVVIVADVCWGQIAYQEQLVVDEQKANAAGRRPLYSPTRCRQNELLYPGDQADDWICDCAPSSLYYPETDACYPAFRKGPCKEENILVLGNNKIIPECLANPCKIDGQIPINNNCYELNKAGPCNNVQLSYVLGVDPKTLTVDCVKLSMTLENRFDDRMASVIKYDLENIDICARGTKRAVQGRCPT